MSTYHDTLFFGGFSIFILLIWLTCLGLGIYLFVLVVKLARRGIIALDLYNHAKNLEIRERYESGPRKDGF
ncbi:hypothetical protein [Paenibacillus sp. MMS20-IR301]|uniref:hypothetical protein n=1 Tax=Paenibacillus sp. MMS20-IR301 TaxID=2895946 RepID=UPI0028E92E36|nr:hypothetical protein [Paenibacillus sp. MMS20-IR301]WNS45828.1 hypothetical protein LOS79_11330 [Paenibacillus sp. MMS20-IR301]